MVYTVTLNPALDCFVRPGHFAPGEVCRYGGARFLPGGKGVNVSLLLRSLGVETTASGIAAGFTGRELCRLLELSGCPADFVTLPEGNTRLNIKIMPEGQPETALNGGGPAVSMEDLAPLERRIAGLAPGDFLVLAGSVPDSLPPDVYPRLMAAAPRGVETVVDTSGPALIEAAKMRPFLIKPNLQELGEAFGTELSGPREAAEYAGRLQALGARNVAVTLGGGGALLLTESGSLLERPALPGGEVSSVGAGDSFVAGFLYGWLRERDESKALDWAMAAGAATAFSPGIAEGDDVRELYGRSFGDGRIS